MKFKNLKKRMAALLSTALIASTMVMPAFAANYTPVAGTSTSFNKYLIVDADATVPEIEFEYTIEAGTAIPASSGVMEVLPGVMVQAGESTEAVAEAWIYDNQEYATEAEAQAAADTDQGANAGEGDYTGITHREAQAAQEATEAAPVIGTAAFEEGAAKIATVQSGDTVVLDEGENYAKKVVNVDFSGVTFDEPGIYRYKITEQEVAGRTDIEYDTQKGANATAKVRYLDVYVTDNAGTLEVSSYVMHEEASTVSTTPNMGSNHTATTVYKFGADEFPTEAEAHAAAIATIDSTTTPGKFIFGGNEYDTEAEAEAAAIAACTSETSADPLADKSDGFVNEFDSQNLTFGKEVEGNQGSKDKYFEFTLNITNASPNMTYAVDLSQAEATSGSNSATIADNAGKTNPATITVDENGAAEVKYYLQDGQYVTVKGLPKDATYALTENSEDYLSANGTSKVAIAAVDAVAGTEESWEVDGQTFTSEQAAKAYVDQQDGTLTYDDIVHNEAVAGTPAVPEKQHNDPLSGTILTSDIYTGFTNTRDGIIPTGIIMTFLPYMMIALAGVFGFAMIARKKR